MNWHAFFLYLSGLLMVAWPFLIGHGLFRDRRVDWGLFFVGAATFLLSQVGHIPFNALMFARFPGLSQTLWATALFAGLSAGVFEEVARALTFRFWATEARSRRDGLMVGLGHGGFEAIVLGLLLLVNGFFIMRAGSGSPSPLIPAEQEPIIRATLQNMQAQPPWWLLVGAAERLFAITLHLALSLLVLRAVRSRRWVWLGAAIGLHALVDAGALLIVSRWGILASEGFVALIALACVVIIWRWRMPGEAAAPVVITRERTSVTAEGPGSLSQPERRQPTMEQLDRTRYE